MFRPLIKTGKGATVAGWPYWVTPGSVKSSRRVQFKWSLVVKPEVKTDAGLVWARREWTHCVPPCRFSSEILCLSPDRLIMTEARKLEPQETQAFYNYVRVPSGLLAWNLVALAVVTQLYETDGAPDLRLQSMSCAGLSSPLSTKVAQVYKREWLF